MSEWRDPLDDDDDISTGYRSQREVGRRLSPQKTSKPLSAESILRDQLRSQGWTREFRDDELTGEQHIELLGAVRDFGRAWLRHESEAFLKHHGVERSVNRGFDRDLVRVADAEHGADAVHGRIPPAREGDPAGLVSAGIHGGDGIVRDGPGDSGLHRPGIDRTIPADLALHAARFFGRTRTFIRELIVAGAMAL